MKHFPIFDYSKRQQIANGNPNTNFYWVAPSDGLVQGKIYESHDGMYSGLSLNGAPVAEAHSCATYGKNDSIEGTFFLVNKGDVVSTATGHDSSGCEMSLWFVPAK